MLHLIPLAHSLGYVDMNTCSCTACREAGRKRFSQSRKASQLTPSQSGALTDLPTAGKERPALARGVWARLIPGFAERTEEVLRERSAVSFAEGINVPVLILQGGADWRSNTGSQALGLANRLQALGKSYELHVYAGDDHPLSMNRLESERKIVEWFRAHTK